MNYKEHLELLNEIERTKNAYLWKFVAAAEVDCVFENNSIDLTDEQFELVCGYVYNYTSTCEMPANELCLIIVNMLEDEVITLDDFKNRWDEIDRLVYSRI